MSLSGDVRPKRDTSESLPNTVEKTGANVNIQDKAYGRNTKTTYKIMQADSKGKYSFQGLSFIPDCFVARLRLRSAADILSVRGALISHYTRTTIWYVQQVRCYFWKINRCSCIISRKLLSCDFLTQKPVALQLNCRLIMSSLSSKPAFINRSITLYAIG